jgi:hypothetical protein
MAEENLTYQELFDQLIEELQVSGEVVFPLVQTLIQEEGKQVTFYDAVTKEGLEKIVEGLSTLSTSPEAEVFQRLLSYLDGTPEERANSIFFTYFRNPLQLLPYIDKAVEKGLVDVTEQRSGSELFLLLAKAGIVEHVIEVGLPALAIKLSALTEQ